MPTRLHHVHLRGYRNFRDTSIQLASPTLVIGANDVGKTNFVEALRLLLDPTLSDARLEPLDSDFHVHADVHDFSITLSFVDVTEACVTAKLGKHISEDGELLLQYVASRDRHSNRKSYALRAGRDLSSLDDIDSRFYLRVLNLRHIAGRRDLARYITYERERLIEDARAARTASEEKRDVRVMARIEKQLTGLTTSVTKLKYVTKATKRLNQELAKLSHRHATHQVVFDVGAARSDDFMSSLKLVTKVADRTVVLGGDGRNNQVHLALWAARNETNLGDNHEPLEVSLFCIEEPEAHLHPHQQRKLAQYLADSSGTQVIITSHSPQIASAFPPQAIVRLFESSSTSLAAGNGATPLIERELVNFGFRLDIVPAEAFFSSVILLVEGRSEVLLYRSVAERIGIDLDRLNISILSVEGVGFKPFLSLFRTLEIPVVVRTDNDISKVPNKSYYQFAGVRRALGLCEKYVHGFDKTRISARSRGLLKGFPTAAPARLNLDAASDCCKVLLDYNIFVARVDLEHDLYDELESPLRAFTGQADRASALREFTKAKANNMFAFVRKHAADLSALSGTSLLLPLEAARRVAEAS